MYNCGLSALSMGLIPSLRFVDVWAESSDLLNKPLNVVWLISVSSPKPATECPKHDILILVSQHICQAEYHQISMSRTWLTDISKQLTLLVNLIC